MPKKDRNYRIENALARLVYLKDRFKDFNTARFERDAYKEAKEALLQEKEK